ncbi:MAG: hypothetical protein H0W82_09725, partial [Actinobacteria bacterium]|nr:hypothetical protein [Actinomycetota bacterium]
MLVLAVVTGPAAADTESELASARERLTAIGQEIEAQRSELAQLQSEADAMATRLQEAESRLEEIQGELKDTQASLARARARLQVVLERFNDRARDAFMQGPATDLNFILGASSMGDLTDRLQYASVLGQADTDLANQVQRLGDQLGMAVAAQKALLVQQTGAVGELDRQMDALNAKFAAQRAAVIAIADEQAEAERIVAGLREKYRDELAAVIPAAATSTGGGGGGSISGVFQACPVGQPRAISDGFGAPRYGGGYHLH